MTTLFHGSALCAVDKDGTVDLPDFVAEALDGEAPDLLIGKHESDGCLIGYDRDHLQMLRARAERRRLAEEEAGHDISGHYRRARRTFGIVEKLDRTGGGRLRIPAAMRHLGGIGKLALFVGTGDNFEIWNPERAMASEDEMFRELAAFRMRSYRGRGRRTSAGAVS